MSLLHDPALAAFAALLFLLGAGPALLALTARRAGDADGATTDPLLGVVPVDAAAAARIAEAHGLAPVMGVAWCGGAWSVEAPDGQGGSLASTVCPWTGRFGAAASASAYWSIQA